MKKLLTVLVLAIASLTANAYNKEAATAAANGPSCNRVGNFYWEIGDKNGKLVSGSVGSGYTESTVISIASASKWLYGAYVVQTNNFKQTDRQYLNMTSGYNSFGQCSSTRRTTVKSCALAGNNNILDQTAVGKFYYGGGHMQHHASLTNLANMNSYQLGVEMSSVLGIRVTYSQPQLAGGAFTNASEYAKFLRSMLNGNLLLGARLGESPVCTLPGVCQTAISSPAKQDWDYSIGHWVERSVDGAYSSTGAFGFYPWINKDKTQYGVISTKSLNAVIHSENCGAAIRKAFNS